jgi:HSP90 family molecular chaperone
MTTEINVSVENIFPNQEVLYSDHEIFLRMISNGTDAIKIKTLNYIGSFKVYGSC